MIEHTILPADQAVMMAMCLNDAVERMPGLTDDHKQILLLAAYLMANYCSDSIVATGQVEQALAKLHAKPPVPPVPP